MTPINTRGKSSCSSEKQGDIFTLRCQFKYKDTITNVDNPTLRIMSIDDKSRLLPFVGVGSFPTNPDRTKWALEQNSQIYEIQIDPTTMPVGFYSVVFEGSKDIGNNTYRAEIKAVIEIKELSILERIANSVMKRLGDDDINSYLETAGRFHHFKASQIMNYIPEGIFWLNHIGPMLTKYTTDNLPENLEFLIARYVFNQILLLQARISIDNDMQVSDAKSLTQNKYDKYKGLYDMEMNRLKIDVQDYKKAVPILPNAVKRNPWVAYAFRKGVSTTTKTMFWGVLGLDT